MPDTEEDLEAARARLRRDFAEASKLDAERNKLVAEMFKLLAEDWKLNRESMKLERDRLLAPVIAVGGVFVGGLGVLATILAVFYHH